MRITALSTPCGCKAEDKFPDGSSPEFTQTHSMALSRWLVGRTMPYFAVHLEGRHILTIHGIKRCKCHRCMGRPAPPHHPLEDISHVEGT
jgi:hypothetical protein